MAKPTQTLSWATDPTYTSGPFPGSLTKLSDPFGPTEGSIPGEGVVSQFYNYNLNLLGQWTSWLDEGTFDPDLTAHIVETNADGTTAVAALSLGSTASTTYPLTITENNTNILINATNNGTGFGFVCQVAGDLAAYRGISSSNTGPIFDALNLVGAGIGFKSQVNTGYAFQGNVTSGVAGNFVATSGIGLGASATTGVGASISATGALPALLVTQTSAPAGRFNVTSGTGVDANATTGIAVDATSTSNDALRGVSTSGTGGRLVSVSGSGAVIASSSGVGAFITSTGNYPLVLTGDLTTPAKGALKMIPTNATPSTLESGAMWVAGSAGGGAFPHLGFARSPTDAQYVWSTKGGFGEVTKRLAAPVTLDAGDIQTIEATFQNVYGDASDGWIEITLSMMFWASAEGKPTHAVQVTYTVDGVDEDVLFQVPPSEVGWLKGPPITYAHTFRTPITFFQQIPVELRILSAGVAGQLTRVQYMSIKITGVYETGDT